MKKDIEILYEDNHIIVVVKPPNLLVQGDRTGDGNLLDILKNDIKLRYNKPGNVFVGLVHRLDRPVGGVMVFAKTSKAASRLSGQMREGKFGKYYTAVVHGVPASLSGTLEHYIVKDEKTNTVKIINEAGAGPKEYERQDCRADQELEDFRPDGPDCGTNGPNCRKPQDFREEGAGAGKTGSAKKAVLDYIVKEIADGLSLVHIRLRTGRPHQVRAQFAATGNPLCGDGKYGKRLDEPGMRLALWSTAISFMHPTLKEKVSYMSAPPAVYPWSVFKQENFVVDIGNEFLYNLD